MVPKRTGTLSGLSGKSEGSEIWPRLCRREWLRSRCTCRAFTKLVRPYIPRQTLASECMLSARDLVAGCKAGSSKCKKCLQVCGNPKRPLPPRCLVRCQTIFTDPSKLGIEVLNKMAKRDLPQSNQDWPLSVYAVWDVSAKNRTTLSHARSRTALWGEREEVGVGEGGGPTWTEHFVGAAACMCSCSCTLSYFW